MSYRAEVAKTTRLPRALSRHDIDAAAAAAVVGFPREVGGLAGAEGLVTCVAYYGEPLEEDDPALEPLTVALEALAAEPRPTPVRVENAHVQPSPGRALDLGSGTHRYDTLYAQTLNLLSDYRLKADIETLTMGLDLIERLRPVRFRYIDGKREHMGFLAQDVRAALLETDPEGDYAVWCSTPVTSTEGTGLPAGLDAVESLRPDQLIAPLVRCCQQLADAVADLTDAVKKQGTQLDWAAETIAAIQKAIRERPSL